MEFLNYEEQAIIKRYKFSSNEDLKEKLIQALNEIKDEDMKNIIKELIPKIDKFSLEDLNNIDNIFE